MPGFGFADIIHRSMFGYLELSHLMVYVISQGNCTIRILMQIRLANQDKAGVTSFVRLTTYGG